MNVRDVIIIGSGPAGLTAAIYTARANLNPLVIEGLQAGGQLMLTTDVENFPGFPQGIIGPDLMANFREQAERFGTEFLTADVEEVDFSVSPKRIRVGGKDEFAKTVIISTGAQARMLGLPTEQALLGRGVSTCATCDGFFFRGHEIAVVGGGDSALEEANFLTKFADKVTLVHRRKELRASKIMQDRAFANPKIEFVWNATVAGITGTDAVDGLVLRDTVSGVESTLPVGGVFVAIGNDPRTHLVHKQLDLTTDGTIAVAGRTSQTSQAGVFAAGDVIDPHYRQAVTAAASGTVAALDAEHYLASLPAELLASAGDTALATATN